MPQRLSVPPPRLCVSPSLASEHHLSLSCLSNPCLPVARETTSLATSRHPCDMYTWEGKVPAYCRGCGWLCPGPGRVQAVTAERGGRCQASFEAHSTDDDSIVIKHLLFSRLCAGPIMHNISFSHALSLQDRCDYAHSTDEKTEAQRGSGVAAGWQVSELRVERVLSDFKALVPSAHPESPAQAAPSQARVSGVPNTRGIGWCCLRVCPARPSVPRPRA